MNDQLKKQVVEDKNATLAADLAWSNDDAWRALRLATAFHETYERLAPSFGYETRPETRSFNPKSDNGRLMVAVCGEILALLSSQSASQPSAEPSEIDELKTLCAEAYQVVGILAAEAGRFDDPQTIKIMDNLSQQKMVHADVLPFASAQPSAVAGAEPSAPCGNTPYDEAPFTLAPPSEAQAAPVDGNQHITAMHIVHEEAGRTLSRDDFDLCMRIAKRALSQQPAVPHGWKLVPIEPTPKMMAAFDAVPHSFGFPPAYRAMLAAAPGTVAAPMQDSSKDARREPFRFVVKDKGQLWLEFDGGIVCLNNIAEERGPIVRKAMLAAIDAAIAAEGSVKK